MGWLRDMLSQTKAGRQALLHAVGRHAGTDRLHRAYHRRRR